MSPSNASLRSRVALPLAVIVLVVMVGTLGFKWFWRDTAASWLDALYMTVITITTIGFREIYPVEGATRWLTMLISVSGIGTFFYLLGTTMEYLVAVQASNPRGRRRMQRTIEQLSGHVIVAGLGRVGKQAAQELHDAGLPFLILDPGEVTERYALERGYLFMRADATEDDTLERAGVHRARGLIATTGNDATNMYIVLSAKGLNPDLYVVSRAVDEASVAKLMRAGANRAISPYAIGGRRLAHLITSPNTVDFFETALRRGNEALNLEEIQIGPSSPANGRALEALNLAETGATLLAVLREGQAMVNPAGSFVLHAGDYVIALGTREVLERLEDRLGARRGVPTTR